MGTDSAPWTTGYRLYYNNPFSQRIVPGWYQGIPIFALDLGEMTSAPAGVTTAPVYIPITGFDEGGTPRPVEGQFYIFSRLPTAWDYTGFCRVIFIFVPASYRANSLRSCHDVIASFYPLEETDLILLLPFL